LNFLVDLNNKNRYINNMKNIRVNNYINKFYNNLNILLKDNILKKEVDRCSEILRNNNYDDKKLYNIYKKEEVDYMYNVVGFEENVIDSIKNNLRKRV
jgi:hypothetical protein